MAGSSVIQAAITALRKATGNDKKHKARLNNIRDAFKQVEADGVPNAEHCTHLVQVLSDDIPALYASRAQPTLVFCGAALGWLFKARLEPALEAQNSESVNVWENTIFRGLMQPILNMIDSDGPGDIGTALYKEICGMMRSLWSDCFGGRFARSLALVLIYTCTTSKNKAMLLDSSILGITALAKLILDAKDYHHLDTLLELSFTMFSSQGGKVSRRAYADSIFASPYALEKLPDSICNELASIHAVTSGDNSEKHILDMMRAMSRGGIERPQVFVTRGLSYCGMGYSQKSPSNVMILDHGSVCLIICDKDGENDVLTVPLTGIQSVELNPDNSRILVEFIIAEAPLISSTRESVATPDGHPAESPLRLRVSIASSDVFGLEAALAARNLAGVLSSQSVLTRNSSLASTKISQAVSSVALKKTDHTEAEELLRKYVNLPSSTSESSPGPVLFKSRVAAQTRARNSPVPSEQPAAPAPIHMQPQQVKPVKSRPARVQPTEPVPPPAHEKAPSVPLANSPVSEKRPPRDRIEKAAFGLDNSELTDADLDRDITAKSPLSETDGGEVQRAVESPPEAQNAPLPTPPRTRARAQQTKPVAKTLVPATPVQDSPVSDLTSPSPKPTRKRKLAEEDPIELPPLDHVTKDDIPPASQGILRRTTAATRAKAKYGATAKRMRVSSPPESIQSTDNEEVVSPERTPAHEAPDAVTADENVPPRPDKKRLAPPGKRLTRAAANKETDPAFSKAPAKTKPVSGRGVSNDEPELAILEKPKPRRGRPPKNKVAQKQGATIPPKDQIRPQLPIELPALEQRNPPRTYAAHPKPSPAAAPDGVGKEDSEGDELLQRLSQAAKKATRTPFVEEPRAPSPSKPVGFPFEDEHVDVESVDPSEPIADLPPAQPESIRSQKHVDTTKVIKNVEATLDAEPSMSRRTKETKSPNAPSRFTKNASSLGAPEEVTHVQDPVNVVSTKAITPQDIRIEDSGEDAPMGDIEERATKGSRIPNSLNSAERKQEQPRTPVLDLAPKPTFAEVPGTPLVQEDPEVVELPKTPLQGKSHGATKRIYPARVQPADQTTPRRDATQFRQVNLQPVRSRIEYISIDSTNTDTQMDGLEDRAPPRAQPQHAGHPSLIVTPTVHSTRQQPSRSRPEPSRATHPAVTRVLFSNQPSPKSALASPVKRTLNNGARPSVSFLDPPAGTLLRRGSSGSSAGAEKRKQQDFERERLLEGKSARTGSVIMNIVDALDRIQAAVVSNIGEKVQAVTTEAQSARAELIKIVVAELDSLVSEAEVHRNALHDLEGMFASQAQALLEGLDRLGDCNTQVLVRAEKMLEKNARAGRGVSENVVNFELPGVFAAFVAE